MDRDALLAHVRATHFESGDRERAVADARRIARFLKRSGARGVVGIGSAFDRTRPFAHRWDIDLVADGIPPRRCSPPSASRARSCDREETLLRRLAAEVTNEIASLEQARVTDRLPATLAAFRERVGAFLSWMLGESPA